MLSFSKDDLFILGYSVATDVTPTTAIGWTAFEASGSIGLITVKSRIIYLKSDCTLEHARTAARYSAGAPNLRVLTPPSLRVADVNLQALFPKGSVSLVNALVWERLRLLFREYLDQLINNLPVEERYVTPRPEGDADAELDKLLLKNFEATSEQIANPMLVVRAPAGVGKTTLSRHLVWTLAREADKYRTIPIYIESSHWSKLRIESVTDLWEIIQTSVQAYCSTIPLTEDLFFHALNRGYLSFIFDGFDELCGNRLGSFDPQGLLDSLGKLCQEGAKILITTRSLYWDSAVTQSPSNCKLISLAPFTKAQARLYFRKAFGFPSRKHDQAVAFYEQVIGRSRRPVTPGGGRAQFVNQPICVVFIADLVERDESDQPTFQDGPILEALLLQICEREQQRQTLRVSKEDQLAAFELIVTDERYAAEQNPEFDAELMLSVGIEQVDLIPICSHHLLDRTATGKLKFKFEFLPAFLRALNLARVFAGATPSESDWRVMTAEANGNGYIVEHVVDILGDETPDFGAVGRIFRSVPLTHRDATSFIFHLALQLVNESRNDLNRKERTEELFGVLFDDKDVSRRILRLNLLGVVHGLDFSAVNFESCNFADVFFRNVAVSEKTIFDGCVFSGVTEFSNPKEWLAVVLKDNCKFFAPANLCWDAVKAGAGTGGRDSIISDSIGFALQKFWHHGYFKQTIREDDWGKGPLAHSALRDVVKTGMLSLGILERGNAAGVREGVLIFAKESLADLQRFMDNRQRTGDIAQLFAYVHSRY